MIELLNASYYNGIKKVELEEIPINFKNNEGINYVYDIVIIFSTDNSIIVKLEIANEKEEPVNINLF